MCGCPLIVLKFGGSVLTDESTLRRAVHEIYRWRREGWRVIAVVSALAGETDQLLAQAHAVADARPGIEPCPSATASLLALGESRSAALLALHLERAGVPAAVLSPIAARLAAAGDELDADPTGLNSSCIHALLEKFGVVVVPGFIGLADDGRTVTLGRGGSDLTAFHLAHELGATRCRLIKDVDGLYEFDPARPGPEPRRYVRATYEDALGTDGSIVQHKAVRYAARRGLAFEIGAFNSDDPTTVGGGTTRLGKAPLPSRPLRVGLLGFGTVGQGVFSLLCELPGVDVVSVIARDPHKPRDYHFEALESDPQALLLAEPDVVIEAIGGLDPAGAIIEQCLQRGVHVITANKAVLAAHGQKLRTLAQNCSATLRASASVGGATPCLEAIRRRPDSRVRSIRGVLNGTTNFILERIRHGDTLDSALAEAKNLGFAEADPTRDLAGLDAADKLRVLALFIGGSDVAVRTESLQDGLIRLQALENSVTQNSGSRSTGAIRHIATLEAATDDFRASVALDRVADDDPLADAPDAWNVAEITWDDGRVEVVRGKGAGRWPTAEAVVADVLELSRELQVLVDEGMQVRETLHV